MHKIDSHNYGGLLKNLFFLSLFLPFSFIKAELLYPKINNTISSIHVQFRWTQAPNAIAYRIKIYDIDLVTNINSETATDPSGQMEEIYLKVSQK